MYAYSNNWRKKEAINLKESTEGFMGGLGWKKGKGEML